MKPATLGLTEARTAIAEAAAWRLLGLLLARPRPGWREEIEVLAEELADGDLKELSKKSGEAREGVYLGLLGPGGPVSPRECSYYPLRDPSTILADLSGFYKAFAFDIENEEPLDHISTELDFVAYLATKQAYAQASEDEEARAITAQALHKFFEDHLREFSELFTQRLDLLGSTYLLPIAQALQRKVQSRNGHGKDSVLLSASSGAGAPEQ